MRHAVLTVLLGLALAGWCADTRPIGVFDSGIGGLTVLEKLLPLTRAQLD